MRSARAGAGSAEAGARAAGGGRGGGGGAESGRRGAQWRLSGGSVAHAVLFADLVEVGIHHAVSISGP